MYIFAYVCILLALLCSLGAGAMSLIQLWENRSDHLGFIRKLQLLILLCMLLASALLLHALFWGDYRLEYVSAYTDNQLPVFYKLTAFWAGQPGSMLFWALVSALCACFFLPAARRLNPVAELWFWSFNCAIMAFFCLILSSWSNPFLILSPTPADGNGLNPLLQNPGMIFHPPLLFAGYAAFNVPACLALAHSLDSERADADWFAITRPYIMLGWILLTAGIVLGAWWAYMELGWGGYWGWDPVENASLLPWLGATATLHVLAVRRAGGKLGRAAVTLMALTVTSAFFATYLTRSGVIQSVHAFGDGGVGTPLLVFVAVASLFSIFIPLSRAGSGPPLATPVSREGALILLVWLLLALALIILIATMWPVFSNMAGSAAQGLDASFYNRVCLPLAAFILLLLCVCAWLGWTGSLAGKKGIIRLIATCGALAASVAAIWIAGYQKPLALVAGSASIAALCSMAMRLGDKSVWEHKPAFCAVGAHFGLALLALGVAFSGPYAIEKDLLLAKGQQERVGAYTVTLENVSDGAGTGYDYLQARLKISEDGQDKGMLAPERRIYAKFGSMQFSEVDVITTPWQDIYASLLGMDEDYRVLVRISLEPMVSWIWVGGALMCVLPLFGIGPIRRRRQDGEPA